MKVAQNAPVAVTSPYGGGRPGRKKRKSIAAKGGGGDADEDED